MSAASYRDAARKLREVLDLLGPYAGPCGFCGHPDRRHRQADAVAAEVAADPIHGPAVAVDEYLDSDMGETIALMVTVAVLATDRRRHALTSGQAARADREVWADLAAGVAGGPGA